MTDEVDLAVAISVPEVDGEDEEGDVDFTGMVSAVFVMIRGWSYFGCTSWRVSASSTMSLTHGGGVMGRRSCRRLVEARSMGPHGTYFVAKATHPGANRLLDDFQRVDAPVKGGGKLARSPRRRRRSGRQDMLHAIGGMGQVGREIGKIRGELVRALWRKIHCGGGSE